MCENELLSRGKYWHFPLLISFIHVKMMTFFGVMFIQDEKLYIGIKRGKKKKCFFFFLVPLTGVKTKGKNLSPSFFRMGGRELVHLTVVSLFSKKRRERREVRENRVRSYERSNERMIGNSIKKLKNLSDIL